MGYWRRVVKPRKVETGARVGDHVLFLDRTTMTGKNGRVIFVWDVAGKGPRVLSQVAQVTHTCRLAANQATVRKWTPKNRMVFDRHNPPDYKYAIIAVKERRNPRSGRDLYFYRIKHTELEVLDHGPGEGQAVREEGDYKKDKAQA